MRPLVYTIGLGLVSAVVLTAAAGNSRLAVDILPQVGVDTLLAAALAEPGIAAPPISPSAVVSGVVTTLAQATTALPAPPAAAAVDETALRYFAQRGDTARVEREIERLRALHPGWQPPENLLSQDYVPDPDIIAIWDLYSAGDFAGARAAIAAKQASDPSFVPSTDLLQSLATGEASVRLRNASDAGENQAVISIAANNPQLLTCQNIDNLWRLAEAFAQTDNIPRATDAYSYILTNCPESPDRFATLQKAMELLPRSALEPLLEQERSDANGVGEFAGLRLDLARRAVAGSLEEGGADPLPGDVTLLEQSATASNTADDLQLLGYYELDRNRPNEARRLFELAHEAGPTAATAEALGVALLQLNDPEEAEKILAPYRDDSDKLTDLYLDIGAALLSGEPRRDIDGVVLGRIVDATMSRRNANTAQELGWYSYAYQQPQTAIEWFTVALRWQTDLEPAAYGMMVAADALGDSATVESIRAQWGNRSARIIDFGRTSPSSTSQAPPTPLPRSERPVEAARPNTQASSGQTQASPVQSGANSSGAGQGASAARGCQTFVPAASLSASAALGHGWCLMELNRPAQAAEHFARALQSGSERVRTDAAYGQSLAFIRLGLPNEAAVAAAAAPVSGARALELEVAILTQQATSAYDLGDYARAISLLDARAAYAAERNDLLTLRAWSYYHLKRYREAQRIFSAVAATGYGDAVGGLDAATQALSFSQ